ncbi:nucleolar protein 8 isoform X2 [Centruroides vittatus]|uniref:nucleolar protein 8 isoform X2 n=1 Tax=Centruroides vittatus TaxID=120091 RepID=UPI0035106F44
MKEIQQPSKIYNDQSEKRNLFDDSDSDESENESKLTKEQNLNDLFRVRAQFEGKKGQKLLELQTRFKNDERFQLDERFLESDDDDDGGGNEKEGLEKLETMDILEERKRNFEILQNVIGVQFPIEPSNKKLKQNYKDMNKLRYDPTSEDAKKFELKHEPKQKDSLKKSKQNKQNESAPIVLPKVSKDQYFQVSSDLKDSFNKTNEFCLLKQFGRYDEEKYLDEKDDDDDNYHTEPLVKAKKTLYLQKNVFKYDSSDEDETTQQAEQASQDSPKQNFENVENKFFLSDDDPRLQEGVKFFKRTETDEEISLWWKEMRPKMLNIIHSKVKTFKHRVLFNNKRKRRK